MSIFLKKFSTYTHNQIHKYTKTNPKISIQNLLDFKNIKPQNKIIFLREDLKSRFAEQITKIDNLPYGLSMMPSIQTINKWYLQSFKDISNNSLKQDTLENIYNRHSSTLITFSNGIMEYKNFLNNFYGNDFNLNEYLNLNNRGKIINKDLDVFYTNRISIRLLISHYLELEKKQFDTNYNGIVSLNEPLTNIINDAIISSQHICERVYNNYPKVNIKVIGDPPIFPFIKNNMFYIFLEIIKNSFKATMAKHSDNIPNVDIFIYNYDNNISIKISDYGEGIYYKDMNNIWSYFFSTAQKKRINITDQIELNDFDETSPLAGYGYGLPITNLLIKYFTDEIYISSIKNVGTDVYLHFHKNIV